MTLAMVMSGVKAGIGGIQTIGGLLGMAGARRPKYQIPAAQQMATGIARDRANQMVAPGELAQRTMIEQSSANAIAAAREYGLGGLSVLPGIAGQNQRANMRVSAQTEEWRNRQEAELLASLARLGQYQDQEFQMNKFAPFADRVQRGQNAIHGGVQNIANAGDSALMALLALEQ